MATQTSNDLYLQEFYMLRALPLQENSLQDSKYFFHITNYYEREKMS